MNRRGLIDEIPDGQEMLRTEYSGVLEVLQRGLVVDLPIHQEGVWVTHGDEESI